MKIKPIILRITLCLFLFSCAAATAQAAEKWLKLSSEHFDMLSCTSERSSKKMLVQLEQFRDFFIHVFSKGRVYDPRPLIFVFDTDKQYKPYQSRSPDGEESPSVGLFISGPFKPRIVMKNNYLEQGLETIFHEYTHSLIATRMGDNVPAWFNEGIAGVFETFSVNGDSVTFGEPGKDNVSTLMDTPLIPTGTLFAVDDKSKYYNEPEPMQIFYAQSWLLVHYSMCGKQNGNFTLKNLLRFVDATSTPGAPVSDTFESVFGFGYDKLEKALDVYMHKGNCTSLTAKIPAKPIMDKISVRAATSEETEIELAGARFAANAAADVEPIMLGLMKKYPDNPRVYEIFAEIKASANDHSAATDYMREAVAKHSANPMVYVWLLRNIYNESKHSLGSIMSADKAAEYRSLVDRALELAPDCMEAYATLAIIESQSPDIRIKKVNEVLKALPDMRERAMTYLAVATVYERMKRYDEAEAAIAELSQDPKSSYAMKRAGRNLLRDIAKETGKDVPPPLPPRKPVNGK